MAWRGLAENVARRFTKGRMVIIDGRLQLRPWVDRDGNRHYATEIVANRAYFGDRPKGEAEQPTLMRAMMMRTGSCPSDKQEGRPKGPPLRYTRKVRV